jgi:hypothetical protein
MAQSLVTYLGGAVKASEWLAAAANPADAFHFFADGFSADPFSADTSVDTAGLHGRINASPGTTTTSTTSSFVVCNAPTKFAFECKGQFDGDGTDGIVGIAAIALNGKPAIASDEGVYFYIVGGVLKFRIRYGSSANDHYTLDIATLTGNIDGVEYRFGFTYEGGVFRAYLDGALKGEQKAAFPAGDMRFAAGKKDSATAKTNQFLNFDYVLISGSR